ncbi:MAG: hypothetical protein A2786_05235 [Candidatus Chisholmbacteria bacterium RIFCSPHIGHO2_01_FULL_52_32]|uniref:YtxH domain-containing protein n=1 Tax=Candidatus Chisholmbacteria bacterium RIFCSPHIGHO2_01_FULL_52_32 TaxID=1797591 RepID=A0A1G1VTW1_9BACT|nr:MAG: hypothetical protein A2786_05235 [Candidatus Chisholmbacteria bacterium RIFCSPHIGHO2_01_FULL_52_32]
MMGSMGKTEEQERHQHGGGFSSGLFWGAILGALGMFMFATKKGGRLRTYLQEHGHGVLSELEEIYEELEEKGETNRLIQSPKKDRSERKESTKEKDVSHIESLQAHGRNVVRYFTRSGRPMR